MGERTGRGTPDTLDRWAFRLLAAGMLTFAFSMLLGQITMGGALLLALLAAVRRRRRPGSHGVVWLMLVFAAIAVMTAVWGANPEKGVSKLPRLAWWLGIPAAILLVDTTERLLAVLRAFMAGCCILAAEICVVRPIGALRGGDGSFIDRVIDAGSMTDGQMLVLGLVVAAMLIDLRARRGERATWEFAALLLQGAGLLLNFKRGSWGCVALVLGAFLVIRLKRRGLVLLIVIALAAVALPPVRQRLGNLGEQFDVNSGFRATMWLRVAPGLIKDHPWGVGYGALTNKMMEEYSWRVEPSRDHLHSNVLQVLAETGWAGLVVYLLWMAKAVLDGIGFARGAGGASVEERTGALCLLLMLAGLLLNGIVEYNFGDTELLVVAAVIMGAARAGRLRCANAVTIGRVGTSIGRLAQTG